MGETPYSMVYETKLVIPVKIGMPSLSTPNLAELRLNLDLLDKKKEWAEVQQAAYKY